MIQSCFFCQNLLSDYVERLLPAARHKEIDEHLKSCTKCSNIRDELVSTTERLSGIVAPSITAPEADALLINTTPQSRKQHRIIAAGIGVAMVAILVTIVLSVGSLRGAILGPSINPFSRSKFVEYAPLAQGADVVVDSFGAWLPARDVLTSNIWDDGGVAVEEFEKIVELMVPQGPEK